MTIYLAVARQEAYAITRGTEDDINQHQEVGDILCAKTLTAKIELPQK